jgi:hypothetical protein
MSGKRSGEGGNASKDPRGNLEAQKKYKKKFNKDTKNCTGFLHHDGPEISISNFRQQKTNANTGLQSRCDLCNRLYFSIIQKPIKRIAAIAIWAEQSGEFDWRSSAPSSLVSGVEKCLEYWLKTKCDVAGCEYQYAHASYRDAAKVLTNAWKDLDKGPRVGKVKDDQTSKKLAAPKFMEDLQAWASTGGTLYTDIDTSTVWDWWCELFDQDTAVDSAEYRAVKNGTMKGPVPEHPLLHFPWGSGNILETVQGHSAPGFNQVRSSQRIMPKASSAASRVYGYLVEGDRLGMAKVSKGFKAKGLSLGHSPAPLRWLGKDDPVNAQGQPLEENVLLSDSLIDLYNLCMEDLDRALACVSWQVRETLTELAQRQVSFEEFTQKMQSDVEKYFDTLLEAIESGDDKILLNDLIRADPGRTITVYEYRHRKVATWLANRPAAIKRKA